MLCCFHLLKPGGRYTLWSYSLKLFSAMLNCSARKLYMSVDNLNVLPAAAQRGKTGQVLKFANLACCPSFFEILECGYRRGSTALWLFSGLFSSLSISPIGPNLRGPAVKVLGFLHNKHEFEWPFSPAESLPRIQWFCLFETLSEK